MFSIVKRSGKIESYDQSKVNRSIVKAAEAINVNIDCIDKIDEKIVDIVEKRNKTSVPVEEFLDVIIESLKACSLGSVADSFSNFREMKRKQRDVYKKLFSDISKIDNLSSKDVDLMRENANVDGNTAMGKMLRIGSETRKACYLTSLINPDAARAHIEGDIHIHDMDFYPDTTTCLQIDLDKLFKDGFDTGHGYVRSPQSIKTASNLACIAIQANQNEQHGGQSIPNFDRFMAKYVDISFYKYYVEAVILNTVEYDPSLVSLYEERSKKEDHSSFVYREKLEDVFDCEYIKSEGQYLCELLGFYPTLVNNIQRKAIGIALKKVKEETYQAMEALVHNLNTLHCVLGDCRVWVRENNEVRLATIKEIYDSFEVGKYEIYSFNKDFRKKSSWDKFEFKAITAVQKSGDHRDMIEIEIESGHKFVTTDNHKYVCLSESRTDFVDVEAKDVSEVIFAYIENFGEEYNNAVDYVSYPAKVVSKRAFSSGDECVYDISVEDNENFVVVLSENPEFKGSNDCGIIVHNSRAGSQVPFSSINFGTDTSDSGRLVAIQLLNAMYAGLGKGETPIFPILIYRVKEGINYNESDPNYDIFKLAIKVSATRMFPNFSFQDTPFNLQYYKEGKPETEITYMGAVLGSSVITIKYEDKIDVLSFEKAYKKYSDKDNVFIFDSSSDDFVKIKTWINNPDGGDWYKIKFSDGFDLTLTSDHPLPTQRGRVECKYLQVGDFVPHRNTYFEKIGAKYIQCKIPQSYVRIEYIKFLGTLNERRYDVETESDRFDVDGINSHNCRTRVIGNVHDKEKEISYSRGNLSFTSINLPRLAIRYNEENNGKDASEIARDFCENYVRPVMELVKNQLLERLRLQGSRTKENFPFLIKEGLWLDSENIKNNEPILEVLKHGTLSIGFIGLAETLKRLYGVHHGESDFAQEQGLKIIKYMRDFCDKSAEEMKLNFTLLATPAEGLCLGGDTLVQCPKGYVKIKDIKDGDYIFSYNEKENSYELDRVVKAGKTKTDKKCVVTFDTGQQIVCTKDHPFAVRKRFKDRHNRACKVNGRAEYIEWIQANELVPGDRVKSCYHRDKKDGYLADSIEDRYLHLTVMEGVIGEKIPGNRNIHHIDKNRSNNDPSNLKLLTSLEHRILHKAEAMKEYRYKSEEIRGERNPFYGKKHTEEMKRKSRETKEGIKILEKIDDNVLLNEFRCNYDYEKIAEKYGVSLNAYNIWIKKLLELEQGGELNHKVISVEFFDDEIDFYDITTEKNHNFFVGGREGILVHNSGRFTRLDKKKYGIIDGVTDKEFYTNSFHVPVEYNISCFEKIKKEAPYHDLTNAGHITYVELDGDAAQNLIAFEKILRHMKESGIGYGAINHPIDRDNECGYSGVIEGNVCPKCKRVETKENPFTRLRRITGYLVGDRDKRFNDAKKAEEMRRVKHGLH